MNKIIIFISIIVSFALLDFGITAKSQLDELKYGYSQLEGGNLELKSKIKVMESLPKHEPVPISREYSVVLNQIRLLESYGGTSMNVQLEASPDIQDISSHYEDTEYKGIRGLKIQIVVDKFSQETDMGAVLDDVHLLEKNTDFMATEISKNNNNLIVKGEVYGL